jgi:GTP-binding protein EngB required for normal cell division
MALSTFLGANKTKKLIKASFNQFKETGPGGYTPLCLWGHKGIGKTSFINQVAKDLTKELGVPVKVISFQLSAMQPFEMSGYPYIKNVRTKDQEIDTQRYATPDFLVQAANTEGYVILFFDEINRARQEMHNALMGYLDGRGVNGHVIPKNCFMVAAANPVTEDAQYSAVTEISDEAILDRLIHVNVRTTQEETLQFIKSIPSVNPAVFNFLNEDRTGRIPEKDFSSVTASLKASDRGFSRLAEFLSFVENDSLLLESVAKGMLGDSMGQLFTDRLNSYKFVIQPEAILNEFTSANSGHKQTILSMVHPNGDSISRLDEVSKINDSLIIVLNSDPREELTKKQLKNLKAYLSIIPHDLQELLLGSKFKPNELEFFGDLLMKTLSDESIDFSKIDFR